MAAYVRELLIAAPIELTEGEPAALVQPAVNATNRAPDQDPTHTRWIVAEPLKFFWLWRLTVAGRINRQA